MQEGKPDDPEKTCGSKYELETTCTYGAGTGNRTRAHWCREEPLRYLLPQIKIKNDKGKVRFLFLSFIEHVESTVVPRLLSVIILDLSKGEFYKLHFGTSQRRMLDFPVQSYDNNKKKNENKDAQN